jgi:tripartite-type tricarboxylate transporter receptor subunit TctC
MCDRTTNMSPRIKGGRRKACAVTTSTRVKSLRDLPRVRESGIEV